MFGTHSAVAGHLFITHGDLLDLACDAILIPSGPAIDGGTRAFGHVMDHWRSLDITDNSGFVTGDAPSDDQPVVKVRAGAWPNPAVWVGHTGGSGRSPADDAGVLAAFLAAMATEKRLRHDPTAARPLADPRPLIGVPLVGTGAGGRHHVRGEVVKAVVDRLLDELTHTDVDVVLVLREAGDYAAAQQARFRKLGSEQWPDLDKRHEAAVSALSQEADAGSLVLFLGAGVSMGAGLPSWAELLDRLLAEVSPPVDLPAAARRELDSRDLGTLVEKGVPDFRTQLRRAVTESVEGAALTRVSLMHQLLASLPVREVITTNYDDLFRTAWQKAGREPTVLPANRVSGRPWLLPLHGTIDDKESMVLSRGDYLRLEGAGSALAGVVQAMLLTRHMLFVGYSLSDDNFHRIMHQVRSVTSSKRDTEVSGRGEEEPESFGTVLTPDPPNVLDRIWDPDVRFVSTATDRQPNVRDQAIFLDRLAAQTSPPGKHLMDESYDAVFSEAELDLRTALDCLRTRANVEGVRPALRNEVQRGLEPFSG